MFKVRFAKMSGAGNDFILIDNRLREMPEPGADWIQKVCRRRFSVGADGLLVLSAAEQADFAMRYFNADGSEASMCGNGGRCIARFAALLGMGKEGRPFDFTTPSGRYLAWVKGSQVRLQLVPPVEFVRDIPLPLERGERQVDFTVLGVPHAVLFVPDVEPEDVASLGREIRFHRRFAPEGTNVNVCQVVNEHRLAVRTYERGVEGETLACGTGSAAATLLAARRGWVKSPVEVLTRSGSELIMSFTPAGNGFSEVIQQGEARLIYWGELDQEATAFSAPVEGGNA